MTSNTGNPNTTLWEQVWVNVNLITMAGGHYGELPGAAIAVAAGQIAWLGPHRDVPELPARCMVHDAKGCWMTPGLIDCHTHLVFAGNRALEFEQRLQGISYEVIARQGGGIRSTVNATRHASTTELMTSASARLQAMMALGVTTVEIKSGYGLDSDTELRMLKTATDLQSSLPISIQRTFLGAHTIPPEYENDRTAYMNLVCNELIPHIAKYNLADAVDIFCETIGMTATETRTILAAATRNGLKTKLHADQLSDMGASALAAEYGSLSADHLEYCPESSVKAMARAGTIAVLLPGACYYLRGTKIPPISLFRKYRVAMAVASDFNPGSSPILSLPTIMNMACTLYGLTPEEALAGVTLHAATALNLGGDRGSLEIGKRADFALWNISRPAELAYWVGHNPCVQRVHAGIIS